MRIRADDTERTITDALSLLSADHERARTLLAILAESPERAVRLRERTLPELVKALRIHLILEEEIFDPAFLAAASTSNDAVLFSQGRAVHESSKQIFEQLQHRHPATADFRALAIVLHDLVETHARCEDEHVFPRARVLMDRATLVALGERMRLRRESLESSHSADWLRDDLLVGSSVAGSCENDDEPDICS